MRRIKRIGETFLHLDDYLLRFLFGFLGGRECLAMELCLNRRLYTREYYACMIDYDDYDKEHEKTIVFKRGDVWTDYWDKRGENPFRICSKITPLRIGSTTFKQTHTYLFFEVDEGIESERRIYHPDGVPTRRATRRVIRCLKSGQFFHIWGTYTVNYNRLKKKSSFGQRL